MRAIQNPQVFPRRHPIRSNFGRSQSLSRTSATIFRIFAAERWQQLPTKNSPKNFPERTVIAAARLTNHPVMDGHGNWSAPDNNQTNN
jgi:hypothetical protein